MEFYNFFFPNSENNVESFSFETVVQLELLRQRLGVVINRKVFEKKKMKISRDNSKLVKISFI